MSRRRTALAAAAALIVLASGWYWGSPWWTLWRIREAARAGDLAGVAAYVDAGAVEADAKAQLKHSWASAAAATLRPDRDSGRRLVALARRELAARRRSFRPEKIEEWLAGIRILGRGKGDPTVVHRGLDAFEVHERGASLETGPVLTFRRHGLGWKLAGVRWGEQ